MKTSRRSLFGSLFAFIATLFTLPITLQATPARKERYSKVQWIQIKDELARPGDFWATHNPNEPERQGESWFNLQMKAVHPNNWGKPAKEIGIGNGAFWRPIGLVKVYK